MHSSINVTDNKDDSILYQLSRMLYSSLPQCFQFVLNIKKAYT